MASGGLVGRHSIVWQMSDDYVCNGVREDYIVECVNEGRYQAERSLI